MSSTLLSEQANGYFADEHGIAFNKRRCLSVLEVSLDALG